MTDTTIASIEANSRLVQRTFKTADEAKLERALFGIIRYAFVDQKRPCTVVFVENDDENDCSLTIMKHAVIPLQVLVNFEIFEHSLAREIDPSRVLTQPDHDPKPSIAWIVEPGDTFPESVQKFGKYARMLAPVKSHNVYLFPSGEEVIRPGVPVKSHLLIGEQREDKERFDRTSSLMMRSALRAAYKLRFALQIAGWKLVEWRVVFGLSDLHRLLMVSGPLTIATMTVMDPEGRVYSSRHSSPEEIAECHRRLVALLCKE